MSVRLHTGIDIGAPRGTPVKGCRWGQVIQASYDSGYGNCILVYHGGGFSTWYAHLQGFNCSVGDDVAMRPGNWFCWIYRTMQLDLTCILKLE